MPLNYYFKKLIQALPKLHEKFDVGFTDVLFKILYSINNQNNDYSSKAPLNPFTL